MEHDKDDQSISHHMRKGANKNVNSNATASSCLPWPPGRRLMFSWCQAIFHPRTPAPRARCGQSLGILVCPMGVFCTTSKQCNAHVVVGRWSRSSQKRSKGRLSAMSNGVVQRTNKWPWQYFWQPPLRSDSDSLHKACNESSLSVAVYRARPLGMDQVSI